MEKKKLNQLDGFLAILIAFALAQLFLIFIRLIIMSILASLPQKYGSFLSTAEGNLILTFFQSLAFILVFIFYYKKTNLKTQLIRKKLSFLPTFLFILVGISLLFLLNYFISFCTMSLNLLGKPSSTLSYKISNWKNYLISILSLCVFPAIGEELLFRGIVLNSMEKKGKILSVVISSILFSAFHLNLSQLFYPILFGMILGIAYLVTDNILVPILIHFFNNAVNITLQFSKSFPKANFSTLTIILSIIGILIFLSILGFCMYQLYKKETKEQESLSTNETAEKQSTETNNKPITIAEKTKTTATTSSKSANSKKKNKTINYSQAVNNYKASVLKTVKNEKFIFWAGIGITSFFYIIFAVLGA